MTAAIIML